MGKEGFTLVELLVVMIIISILALLGAGGYFIFIEKARENTARNALKVIQIAIEMYSTVNKGFYPMANNLMELKEQLQNYLPGGDLPANPFNNQPYSDSNNYHYKITYTYDPRENAYTLTVMDRYNIRRLFLLSNKTTVLGE